ncbi:MAG: hypothetical protein Q9224_006032 [Gallowayella concinna]
MILLLFLLLSLTTSCLAVTVTLLTGNLPEDRGRNRIYQQICHNLRPGQCCRFRPFDFDHRPRGYREAEFTALEPLHIAAFWKIGPGCTGVPLATQPGPGNFLHWASSMNDIPPWEHISGASYIKLPVGPPRDSDAPWMEAEGILGFVWGDGRWVSSKASKPIVDQVYSLFKSLSFGARKRGIVRRNFFSGKRGQVFAQPPAKASAVWPDMIVANGTNYREQASGSPVYRSDDGKLLDLTGYE